MTMHTVYLTDDAQVDLQDIYDFVAENDAPRRADQLLQKLETLIAWLSQFPQRGAVTKELRLLGIADYREVYFKPYRVIYRASADSVYVYLVVDGRRDMQSLLTQRLLRS